MSDRIISNNVLRYSMKENTTQKISSNNERKEQQTNAENTWLPKKTNRHCVPKKYLYKGTTDSMEWEEREKKICKNNEIYTKEQYEKMGIKVTGKCDDLFYSVELPFGWVVKATDHPMWNRLMDGKGRVRLSFFCKVSWHGRDAFSNFVCRYSFSILPFDHYKTDASYEERKFKPWHLFITDCDKHIKKLAEVTADTDEEYYALNGQLQKMAKDFLDKHYPEWEDVNAYWD